MTLLAPRIYLGDLPIPPSSNAQYKTATVKGKIRRVSAACLKNYQTAMEDYYWTNHKYVLEQRKRAKLFVGGNGLSIHCTFHLPKSKIFTKDGHPVKMDVSNLLKASHDEIAKLLQIDDSYFFKISAEKAVIPGDLVGGGYLVAEICPMILNNYP